MRLSCLGFAVLLSAASVSPLMAQGRESFVSPRHASGSGMSSDRRFQHSQNDGFCGFGGDVGRVAVGNSRFSGRRAGQALCGYAEAYPVDGYYNSGAATWESDSFNDWWHDRPDRAFPRWMQHNQDCARLWWGGGGWRC
jgi:hypothetical protein